MTELKQNDRDAFLASSEIVDFYTDSVRQCAETLCRDGELATAKACFRFVRDEIHHSWDFQRSPTTLRASEVLQHRTGYCYAKSHLLAALLRANDVPTGFCYQRLAGYEDGRFCLHGLNAIFLHGVGWYRVDARGNKPGVDAAFCPPTEQLAFKLSARGEADLPGIYPEPRREIVACLNQFTTWQEVADNLPDVSPPEI